MLNGKTHYFDWPCSIAFSMFTRPGTCSIEISILVHAVFHPRPQPRGVDSGSAPVGFRSLSQQTSQRLRARARDPVESWDLDEKIILEWIHLYQLNGKRIQWNPDSNWRSPMSIGMIHWNDDGFF